MNRTTVLRIEASVVPGRSDGGVMVDLQAWEEMPPDVLVDMLNLVRSVVDKQIKAVQTVAAADV